MKNKILFGLRLLFGMMFINSRLNKFFNYLPMPKDMPESMFNLIAAFIEISWLMPLIAFTEILSGVLFIIIKYRALGAIIVFPVMTGILLTNIINAPSGISIVIVLLTINL